MSRDLTAGQLADLGQRYATYEYGVDELVARVRALLPQDGQEVTALNVKMILQTSFPADQIAGLAAVALVRIAEQQRTEPPRSQPESTSERR